MRVWQLLLVAMLAVCVSCGHARSSHFYESGPVIYATNFGNSTLSFRLSDGAALGDVLVGADQNTTSRAPAISLLGFCFQEDNLYLVDQRAGEETNGGVQLYAKRIRRGVTDFVRKDDLVGISAPNGPFAPQDVLIRNNIAYVIDIGDRDLALNGRIARFDLRANKVLGDLSLKGLTTYLPTDGFHPTGAVFGPDDGLYVTARSLANPAPGFVFKWNVMKNKFLGVIIQQDERDTFLRNLHRPDSPRFGPDGTFTVNSFRIVSNATDLDRILVFPPKRRWGGMQPYTIDIPNASNGDRIFSQESIFGPHGKLYASTNSSEIRAYRVPSKNTSYKVIVPADASRLNLRNIGFEKTDCATLAYRD